jgi:hypothetical protein
MPCGDGNWQYKLAKVFYGHSSLLIPCAAISVMNPNTVFEKDVPKAVHASI